MGVAELISFSISSAMQLLRQHDHRNMHKAVIMTIQGTFTAVLSPQEGHESITTNEKWLLKKKQCYTLALVNLYKNQAKFELSCTKNLLI